MKQNDNFKNTFEQPIQKNESIEPLSKPYDNNSDLYSAHTSCSSSRELRRRERMRIKKMIQQEHTKDL